MKSIWMGTMLLVSLGCAAQESDGDGQWDIYGNARLRAGVVQDLVGRDDLERGRGRVRVGARRLFDSLEFGFALEGALGSDDNRDNRRNNDNERSDAGNVDELYLRWNAGEQTQVLIGRSAMPLSLSPMLWDDDLRPIGAAVSHSIPVGDFDRLQLSAGWFAGTHLYQDDSRISAVQASWFLREGAEISGDVQLAYLVFDDLEQLTAQGLARTNRRVGAALVSDYEIADLQAGLKFSVAKWPVKLRVDLARNLGAETLRDAGRVSATIGDKLQPMGWEFGYAGQRIQRDAAMAAFNDDDWWFHSFSRGHMGWIGYGIDEHISVQFAMLIENREGLADDVDRFLVDLNLRW